MAPHIGITQLFRLTACIASVDLRSHHGLAGIIYKNLDRITHSPSCINILMFV